MKKITIHKKRVPLMAEATDGIKSGSIDIEEIEGFIHQCVDEFEDCAFTKVKLTKMCLAFNEHMDIDKITFKEKK